MARTIIVDIDGTVADLEHRRHYLASSPKNWQAFEAGIPFDKPHQHVIDLVNTLYSVDWTILMCSGRGEQSRGHTESWLSLMPVSYHKLYMRAKNDFRPDNIVKSELLDQILAEGYTPSFVLDDRNSVCEMWRSRNIPCFQVAPGDF